MRALTLLVSLVATGCIALPDALPPPESPDGAVDGAGGARADGGEGGEADAAPEPDAAVAMPEVCNGLDDDLDGFPDEGVRTACGTCDDVPAEICDGFDNDCDLVIDEEAGCACPPGTTEPCGADVGACVAGTRSCSPEGQWGPCSGTRPEPELCNGIDDDCNGEVDDGVTNACNTCDALPDEVCNGVDDDCNGIVDGLMAEDDVCECPPDEARPCGTDEGECTSGRQVCTFAGWGECQDAIDGGPEQCNQLDDDCDGMTDEGVCDCAPGDVRECGTDVGRCANGQQRCMAGAWGDCVGATGPIDEACNGEDDDCDGVTDEDACDCPTGQTRPCGSDIGECREGTQTCTVMGWGACTGDTGPRGEQCNGLDDDCDGAVDETWPALGAPCSAGVGACRRDGEIVCRADGQQTRCSANAGQGQAETCNGDDDDCDGTTDEELDGDACDTGQDGQCAAGTRRCQGGTALCDRADGPTGESCDGRDEDCDGRTDEGTGGGACDTGQPGRCGPGTRRCAGGSLECDRNQGPVAEACNGTDDDCDGDTDEDTDGQGCVTGEPGRCSAGTVVCTNGDQTCNANQGPVAEQCNGVDDDCDGSTDEGTDGNNCDTGLPGPCGDGIERCQGAALVCDARVGAQQEVCNNVDDDCDGRTDEGLGGGGCNTGQPGRCAAGTEACIAGNMVCNADLAPINEACNGIDDDCDGAIDDPPVLMPPSCDTGQLGVCADGTPACENGQLVCQVPRSGREFCDQLDNDCDGRTDEDAGGGDCNTGLDGVCATGTFACLNGDLQCLGPAARPEGSVNPATCNGVDDDCDGNVDEDHPGNRACERGTADYECINGRVELCAIDQEPEPGPDPEPIPR